MMSLVSRISRSIFSIPWHTHLLLITVDLCLLVAAIITLSNLTHKGRDKMAAIS